MLGLTGEAISIPNPIVKNKICLSSNLQALLKWFAKYCYKVRPEIFKNMICDSAQDLLYQKWDIWTVFGESYFLLTVVTVQCTCTGTGTYTLYIMNF